MIITLFHNPWKHNNRPCIVRNTKDDENGILCDVGIRYEDGEKEYKNIDPRELQNLDGTFVFNF